MKTKTLSQAREEIKAKRDAAEAVMVAAGENLEHDAKGVLEAAGRSFEGGGQFVDWMNDQFKEIESKLPKDAQKKLKAIKSKLDKFQKLILKKFENYIIGIALLPPKKPEKDEKPSEKINVLVLVDDSDSKKMSKDELKTKLSSIIEEMAKDVDKNLAPQTIILSELWQSCYDAKYEL